MPHIGSVANLFLTSKSIIETTANLCGVGAACAAAWAFFYPEQAADHWVKFEAHIAQARDDLSDLRASNEEIVTNTSAIARSSEQTTDNTNVVARWVNDMSSVERGLEVYSNAYASHEDSSQALLYINVGNASATPLEEFTYFALDGQGSEIGTRKTARLLQNTGIEAELSMLEPASAVLVDGYSIWVCASGKIRNTETIAYLTVELEGHLESSGLLNFSVVRNDVSNEVSEACQLGTSQ